MPQLTSIVLKDAADANVTFLPKGIVGNVATVVNSTGVPIGERRMTFAISQTQTGRRKSSIKLTLPIVQDIVVSGITKPTVVRNAYVDVVVTHDDTSSTAERADTLAFLKSALANEEMIEKLIVDLEGPY